MPAHRVWPKWWPGCRRDWPSATALRAASCSKRSDRIDAGDTPEPRPFDPNHHRIDRYDRAAPAERARLRAHYELADPRRLGLYRAGEAIDEGARAAFPTHPEHAGDFGHVLARGAGNLIGYGASALVGGAVGGAPAALATAIGLGAGGGAARPPSRTRSGTGRRSRMRPARPSSAAFSARRKRCPSSRPWTASTRPPAEGSGASCSRSSRAGARRGCREFAAHVAGNLVASDVVRYDPGPRDVPRQRRGRRRGASRWGRCSTPWPSWSGAPGAGAPGWPHDARDEAGAPPPPSETLADAHRRSRRRARRRSGPGRAVRHAGPGRRPRRGADCRPSIAPSRSGAGPYAGSRDGPGAGRR